MIQRTSPPFVVKISGIALVFALVCGSIQAREISVERGSDLQSVINFAQDGDTLILGPKIFSAKAHTFLDTLCGNCQIAKTSVNATVGFEIKNKSITIIGRHRQNTQLVTNAGYGVYFENSPNSVIRNLTITGGIRDSNGSATDAGIVVRSSRVLVEDVDIRDNSHRLDSVIVGIGGIFGREGADLAIRNCQIVSNGWDGIALYRGAIAFVSDCVIKDGRGAGIGVTWDATCTALRNDISGYWKGIGAFGTSWVIARNNLVHDNLGWGMIATGQSYMDMTNNVVYHNGNCGIAPWSTDSRGRIVNNIIAENGWRKEWVCPCVGIWNYGDWAKWYFAYNIVWHNSAGEYQGIWDQSGLNGNLNEDPKFIGAGDFLFADDSPGFHKGDSTINNPDGTHSHIGLFGGPQAWPTTRRPIIPVVPAADSSGK